MLKFPVLPENLAGVDVPALMAEYRNIFALVKNGTIDMTDPDAAAKVTKATEEYGTLKAHLATEKAAQDEVERVKALAAALSDDEDPEVVDDTGDPEEEDAEDEAVEEDDEGEASATDPEPEVKAAAQVPAKVKPRKGVGAKTTEAMTAHPANEFSAMDGVPGKKSGEHFESYVELAESLYDRSKTVGKELVPVGAAYADYPKERILGDGPQFFNLASLDGGWGKGTEEELTAAFCAPCTPYYDISCANTDRRPVFNSLPQFQAPRGCVSIYSSPVLADITGGYGIWDKDDDSANPLLPKNACMTINCGTTTDYYFYAVYRCLTVQNFTQMTFPELVAAYLNLLAAASARQAEIQLLDLMNVGTNAITASAMGLSASASITVQLQHYLDGYAERARWDTPQMEMWAPRWLAGYIKGDITLRKNLNGGPPRVGTDADVAEIFNNLGITPHWYMDKPTWGTTAPVIQAGVNGALPNGPTSVKLLLAPRGKYALIDRGELRVGVTGNVMRDNTSLSYNQFTMFFETFEGIVDTNTCPADLLTLPVCFNGVQVGDAETVDCAGLSSGPS